MSIHRPFLPTTKLIAFGNVLLDFSFSVEDDVAILRRFDLRPNDLGECSIAKLQRIREDASKTCRFLKTQPGGSALNTMKMLRMLGEEDGVFCGMVGADENADIVRAKLRECGLNVYLQVHPTLATGQCVCLLDGENRCCYANIGASSGFDIDLFEGIMFNILTPSKQIFYVEGFFITANRFPLAKTIVDLFQYQCPQRAVAINLSASYIVASHFSQIKYLAERCHIVFGNLDEYQRLTDMYGHKDVCETMRHLIAQPSPMKILVCTDGAGRVRYAWSDCSGAFTNLEFKFVPVPSDKIVDTTGCGDAFVAGFFYAYLRHKSVAECIRKGVDVASDKLQKIGGII